MEKKETSFKWSNYTKPTPANLKMFMEFWKGLTVFITGLAVFQHANEYVSVGILVFGYLVDRLAKFFAYVEEHETQVTINIPGQVKDQISVETKEVKPE